MSNDEIYKKMYECIHHAVAITLKDGRKLDGVVHTVESRSDNEDEEGDLKGKGVLHLRSGSYGALVSEDDIESIETKD